MEWHRRAVAPVCCGAPVSSGGARRVHDLQKQVAEFLKETAAEGGQAVVIGVVVS